MSHEAAQAGPVTIRARRCDEKDSEPERASASLLAAIRREHQRGETGLVDGWKRAVTEARILALVALAETDGGSSQSP